MATNRYPELGPELGLELTEAEDELGLGPKDELDRLSKAEYDHLAQIAREAKEERR